MSYLLVYTGDREGDLVEMHKGVGCPSIFLAKRLGLGLRDGDEREKEKDCLLYFCLLSLSVILLTINLFTFYSQPIQHRQL